MKKLIIPTVLMLSATTVYTQQQRPNILFCIADDASYHHFSANGCSWVSTPSFDRISAEGVRFTNCYTPNAKSAPSRACVLTGRNSWQLKEAANHICNFPAEFKVFTEVLSEQGYLVGYTGKSWAPGNPGHINGAPRQLTGKPYNNRTLSPPAKFISKTDYVSNFSDFLTDSNGEPWFFWFGSQEPHRAYERGVGERLGGKNVGMIDKIPAYYPDNDTVRMDMLDYAFEIEYLDTQLGLMLEELQKKNMLNNTIIVVTSDNGMPFPRSKANNYEYANHMPLAVMWKDGIVKPGRVDNGYISFIDYAPTFLEAAKVSQLKSGMQQITGISFMDVLTNSVSAKVAESRRSILLGRERDDYGRPLNQGYPIRSIIRDNMMLVVNLKPESYPAGDPATGYLDIDGSPTKTLLLDMYRRGVGESYWSLSFGKRAALELYDLTEDIDCMKNLATIPSYAKTVETLKKELFERLTLQQDPRITGNGDVFDRYPFDTQDKENFYERVVSGELKEPWKQTNWINASDYQQYLQQLKQGTIAPYDKTNKRR